MSDGQFQTYADVLQELENELIWGPKNKNPMTGVELIAQERLEQKTKHGYSLKRDSEVNKDNELAIAAISILTHTEEMWPKKLGLKTWNHISGKPWKEQLAIVGALIAAEIDRLNFKE